MSKLFLRIKHSSFLLMNSFALNLLNELLIDLCIFNFFHGEIYIVDLPSSYVLQL